MIFRIHVTHRYFTLNYTFASRFRNSEGNINSEIILFRFALISVSMVYFKFSQLSQKILDVYFWGDNVYFWGASVYFGEIRFTFGEIR